MYFSAAAEADNLKLHQINFRLSAPKGRFAPSRSWRRCFLLFFLRTGVKLHFYSLGTNLRRKHGVSIGEYPLGSGFPIGASNIPVGTRFCSAKSSVLYLLRPLTRERDCRRIGQAVSSGSRRANICKHGRLADIRSSGVGGAALRRSMTEAMLYHRGSKRYIKPAAATHPRSPNTTTAVPARDCPAPMLQLTLHGSH